MGNKPDGVPIGATKVLAVSTRRGLDAYVTRRIRLPQEFTLEPEHDLPLEVSPDVHYIEVGWQWPSTSKFQVELGVTILPSRNYYGRWYQRGTGQPDSDMELMLRAIGCEYGVYTPDGTPYPLYDDDCVIWQGRYTYVEGNTITYQDE